MATIDKELKEGFRKSKLPNATIFGREKHLYSIYKKMLSRHIPFSEIMDVYAFRIILDTEDDCYEALGIVHRLYKPIPGKFNDYIAIPKFNGYQSLHTTLCGPFGLPIEIQIRTHMMDKMANSGIASHWLYKTEDQAIDISRIRTQEWVNNLLEIQQNTGNSLEFLENVKIDLFPESVYVFTPKGLIIELPKGTTVVDFAYEVHTDIGNSCVAARIDRQFMPLTTVLTSGQTISVITSPQAKPNPSWLRFVVTGKARAGIRNFLKNQKKEEAIALGKQLMEKALLDLSLSISEISPDVIKTILKDTKLATLDDLYENIGLGNNMAMLIAHQMANTIQHEDALLVKAETKQKPLLIKDAKGIAINFAPCCFPIPDDEIIGYFNVGHGLAIHRKDCSLMAKLKRHPEKCLLVNWADEISGEFITAVNVVIMNQKGALAQLAKTLADNNSSINNISMNEIGDGYCLIALQIMVHDSLHLENILEKIRNIPVVVSAKRK